MVEIYDAEKGELLTFASREKLERFEQFGEATFIEARKLNKGECRSVNGSFLYFD